MKIGDYVRYKYENCIYIGKIKFISEVMGYEETLQLDIDNCMEEILKEEIIKSSPNIIDLIEEGDYVNGSKVWYIDDLKGCMRQFNYDYENPNDDCGHWEEEIQSVVTKEQFESIEYKVGD